MPSSQQYLSDIKDQIGKNTAALHDVLVRSNEKHAETKAKIGKMHAEFAQLKTEYNQLSAEIAVLKRPRLRDGSENDEIAPETRAAFDKYLRHGPEGMTDLEKRALSSASDKSGGFLVPATWESGIIMDAFDKAELRPLMNVGQTGSSTVFIGKLSKPKVGWGTVNVAVNELELSAGAEKIDIHDLEALTLIHKDTLKDSQANIWLELRREFANAIAEAEDDAFAVGTGNGQPLGFFVDKNILKRAVNTGVANALTDGTKGIDFMQKTLYTLKKPYRRNATWAMNSFTESIVRSIKDSDGQYYLWRMPNQSGENATILGKPVVNPEESPDIAANSYPIMLADFQSGYKVRDRQGLEVLRLDERYAELRSVGFLVTKRLGGSPVKAECFVPVKVAV